jgi:Trm5-related predicted tRNA methylase
MQATLEQIRQQIHEIRNFLSPLDLKLENLDHQVTASRIKFESKTTELEAKISVNSLRVAEHAVKIDEHSDELARQSERIKRIESFLKMSQRND